MIVMTIMIILWLFMIIINYLLLQYISVVCINVVAGFVYLWLFVIIVVIDIYLWL